MLPTIMCVQRAALAILSYFDNTCSTNNKSERLRMAEASLPSATRRPATPAAEPRAAIAVAKGVTGAALIATGLLWATAAHANRLHVEPDAPAWAHLGAAALLTLHIGGGAMGVLSGVAALVFRKGGRLHRAAGAVFLAAMFVAYLLGAGVAPFLDEGQRPNFTGGVLALYFLASGWVAARRRDFTAGASELVGLVVALAIAGAGVVFMRMGAASPTGTVDGSPPEAFVVFIVFAGFAAAGELHALLRRRLVGLARVARHLWRMCASFFFASASFFLGQQAVMPEWVQGSPVLMACAFAPLIAMAFWLVRIRLPGRLKRSAAAG